jgi:hypothetical protein
MIRFIYTGTMRVGFDSIHREVGQDEEFDVPDEFALSFANHGYCRPATDADAAAVQALRDAEDAAHAEQARARAAHAVDHGLVDAHPFAPQPVPDDAPKTAAPRGRAAKTAPADTETAPAAAAE